MKIIIDFDYEIDGEQISEEEIFNLFAEEITIHQTMPRFIDKDSFVILVNSFEITKPWNQNQ